MFAGYLFLRFKGGHEIRQINPSQTLMNLQYHIKHVKGRRLSLSSHCHSTCTCNTHVLTLLGP